ncbi:arginine--tRNA ligase [Conexibacter stalactiti]|uniref:Arginine--tRNA ligase n=1 Tax=Conexibacter stalactiti TaxID=1940611 RepID=A0ABU4HII1_9ACTN|nr:arginine--tRNA ligase [Conexibacter stalactiti]MDW5593121.1 arginine--tRNA ligase [Conexibacter stalactiti]MEC5033762.1 arginine--tRNA ligase [Conexibacter stalactiti]
MTPLQHLRAAVEEASAALRGDGAAAGGTAPTVERPRREGFGDYSTNAAMLLAPSVGKPPREIAELLGAALQQRLGAALERYEVAGPGFLNLFLADGWYGGALEHVLDAGERFGAGGATAPERILVEFVSANPTGPVVAASGRHAAFGDALARILEFHGHEIAREYYLNDAGSQVRKLGESVRARARGEDVPEGGYEGDYVIELAAEIPGAADGDPDELATIAVGLMYERIKATLTRYGVEYDRFFSEKSLYDGDPSPVQQAQARLEQLGHTYRHEGALWLRTTSFGDDKDRVLERSNGEPTYFASDVAYMESKRERGFERQLNVFGADHHGYVARLKAAMEELGGDPEKLEILIMRLVHFVEGGEREKMSKRRGVFTTLDELLDELGVDATRYFMLQRTHDTSLDLDLDLARKQSSENPVYYVQYAHARIASMLERAGETAVAAAVGGVAGGDGGANGAAGAAVAGRTEPLDPAERTLLKKLLAFPDEIAEAAEKRAPHRLTAYALELAQDFTAFYRDCRVLGAEGEGVEAFRIALLVATRRTIARTLALLGVSAPDSMARLGGDAAAAESSA